MVDQRLIELLRCVFKTCDDEIDGSAWDKEICRVAELIMQGEDVAPTIQQYLDNSPDCREELFAMVAMLRAEHLADSATDSTGKP